jgi:hypothetical protein
VELAIALRLVQREAGAKRDGMAVPDGALEGGGHGRRDRSTRRSALPRRRQRGWAENGHRLDSPVTTGEKRGWFDYLMTLDLYCRPHRKLSKSMRLLPALFTSENSSLPSGDNAMPYHHGLCRSTIVLREPVANSKKSIEFLCDASPTARK